MWLRRGGGVACPHSLAMQAQRGACLGLASGPPLGSNACHCQLRRCCLPMDGSWPAQTGYVRAPCSPWPPPSPSLPLLPFSHSPCCPSGASLEHCDGWAPLILYHQAVLLLAHVCFPPPFPASSPPAGARTTRRWCAWSGGGRTARSLRGWTRAARIGASSRSSSPSRRRRWGGGQGCGGGAGMRGGPRDVGQGGGCGGVRGV